MEETAYIYFAGTAGSGKSMLTASFDEWCRRHRYNVITVNLDPGVRHIPYDPEIDVREWIVLEEVMKEYGLGPNGAQIVCADMIALNVSEIEERLGEYRADYVLFDTPGQLELFAFRSAGKVMLDHLGRNNSLLGFLIDPALSTTPAHFVSQLMLSAVTQFKLEVPLVNILSKADMIEQQTLEMILEWGKNPDALYEELMQGHSLSAQLGERLIQVIREMEGHTRLIPLSSETLEGMEDLYTSIQHAFYGGEDLEKS